MENVASNTLYTLAYNAYERREYAEGVHFFRMLTLMECHIQKHWIGLAACYQMQNQFDEAVPAYSVAAVIDPANPQVHLHAAECLFALGRKEEGENALISAEHYISNDASHGSLRSELDFIRKKWNNNFSV